ncbi:LysE family translocator [Tabrizicola sp.]|uniref:LysE family translocator n=1 Tax=Tabrizicola sp. TaxID=2005166 RepID=UPI0035B02108
MDYHAFGPYILALVAYAASPGPIMAVLVVRSLGKDWKDTAAFATGLCVAEVIAVLAVLLGIGVWAQSQPHTLALAKYLGVAYLLWLAVQMWSDTSTFTSSRLGKVGWLTSATAGLALSLGNPSTLLMQMLLVPIVAPKGVVSLEHGALVVLATFAAFGLIFYGTIPLARQFNRIISSRQSTGLFNRLTAGVIALTSVWILLV